MTDRLKITSFNIRNCVIAGSGDVWGCFEGGVLSPSAGELLIEVCVAYAAIPFLLRFSFRDPAFPSARVSLSAPLNAECQQGRRGGWVVTWRVRRANHAGLLV